MWYDGAGVNHLYKDRLDYIQNKERYTEIYNPSETKELGMNYYYRAKSWCYT